MSKNSNSRRDKSQMAKPTNEEKVSQLIEDLRQRKYKKVVFLVGAGISTEAGIPDFRSPKTGLYANLQRFKLPYPEAVFDIDYSRENPQPFFMLAKEMFPSQFQPTSFHRFMKWVADLGILKRVYTQNIDTLELRAGIPAELVVEAHGSFNGNHCIECKAEIDDDEKHLEIEQQILSGKMPTCEICSGIVKPNIVFFGESLPTRFFDNLDSDFVDDSDIDLVIVAGTSLQVSPFNQLPDMVSSKVTRYLFNLEKVGSLGQRKRDVLVLGSLKDLALEVGESLDDAEEAISKVKQTAKSDKPQNPADGEEKTSSKNDEQVESKNNQKDKRRDKETPSASEEKDAGNENSEESEEATRKLAELVNKLNSSCT